MPAVSSFIIAAIWDQFAALLPVHQVNHPLGCLRPRIPNRVVFDTLVHVLVLGCADTASPTQWYRPPRSTGAAVIAFCIVFSTVIIVAVRLIR